MRGVCGACAGRVRGVCGACAGRGTHHELVVIARERVLELPHRVVRKQHPLQGHHALADGRGGHGAAGGQPQHAPRVASRRVLLGGGGGDRGGAGGARGKGRGGGVPACAAVVAASALARAVEGGGVGAVGVEADVHVVHVVHAAHAAPAHKHRQRVAHLGVGHLPRELAEALGVVVVVVVVVAAAPVVGAAPGARAAPVGALALAARLVKVATSGLAGAAAAGCRRHLGLGPQRRRRERLALAAAALLLLALALLLLQPALLLALLLDGLELLARQLVLGHLLLGRVARVERALRVHRALPKRVLRRLVTRGQPAPLGTLVALGPHEEH